MLLNIAMNLSPPPLLEIRPTPRTKIDEIFYINCVAPIFLTI
jgi:hypothetical protein